MLGRVLSAQPSASTRHRDSGTGGDADSGHRDSDTATRTATATGVGPGGKQSEDQAPARRPRLGRGGRRVNSKWRQPANAAGAGRRLLTRSPE